MANISLEGSLRTCKVDTGWANKIESDRFLNPQLMLCPVWQGYDSAGRQVPWDSFYTKTPGCNSAAERINVENELRPQYIEYVTLDATGIRGDQYCGYNKLNPNTACQSGIVDNTHNYTGQFGYDTGFQQNIQGNCMTCTMYPDSSAQQSQNMRANQFKAQGIRAFNNSRSGFTR